MDPALGEFGVAEGIRSRLALAAPVLAGVGIAFALVRPLGAGDARWATRAAVLAALAAILSGIVGGYLAATRGIGGRTFARTGIAAGALVGLYAFLDAATRDGKFRPGKFVERYLDGDIMRALLVDFRTGIVRTIKYAATAEVVAIAVGLIVATFVMSPRRRFRWPALTYVDLVRGTPLVVLAGLIGFGLPTIGVTFEFFAAMTIILAMNASAYIAEIFRGGIQSVPRGQMDAARSLGMPRETAMTTVVLPQAIRSVIPPLMSEFIALVKDTAIVASVLGTTFATRELFETARTSAASTFSPTPFFLAALFYLVVTVPAARLVGRLEKRLRAGLA